LGQLADGLGWIGSHKMDPWTTLHLLIFLYSGRLQYGGFHIYDVEKAVQHS